MKNTQESAARQTKIAIVTGAGASIGRAIALKLVSQGVAVVIADRDLAAAKRVQAELEASGGQALAIQADVTVAVDLKHLVDAAIKK